MLSLCLCAFIISNFFFTSSVYTCIFHAYEKVCIMHLLPSEFQTTEGKQKKVIKIFRKKR